MRKCLRLLRHPLRVLTFGEQSQSVASGTETHLVTNKMSTYEEIIFEFLHSVISGPVRWKHGMPCNINVYIAKKGNT